MQLVGFCVIRILKRLLARAKGVGMHGIAIAIAKHQLYLMWVRFICGYFHVHKLEMGPTG